LVWSNLTTGILVSDILEAGILSRSLFSGLKLGYYEEEIAVANSDG
jgi:hypothetical protein